MGIRCQMDWHGWARERAGELARREARQVLGEQLKKGFSGELGGFWPLE